MRVQKVIEVTNNRLRAWADELSDPELQVLVKDPASDWWAWDAYFNWLLSIGWRLVAVLGSFWPADGDPKVMIVVESDGSTLDPDIPND